MTAQSVPLAFGPVHSRIEAGYGNMTPDQVERRLKGTEHVSEGILR